MHGSTIGIRSGSEAAGGGRRSGIAPGGLQLPMDRHGWLGGGSLGGAEQAAMANATARQNKAGAVRMVLAFPGLRGVRASVGGLSDF